MIKIKKTSLYFREVSSYTDVRSEVREFLASLLKFIDTKDFNTYIMADGFNMTLAKGTFMYRKDDLIKDCAVVIAGN